jgi:Domain of unknown function (DUF5615)
MASPRFLFDEDVHRTLAKTLRAQDPTIDIVCVGEDDGPPKSTLDPELLEIAETTGRLFVSDDRNTMPQHLFDHFAKGHHTHGVVLLRKGFALVRYVYEIMVIYQASSADEWIDRTVYLP